MGFCLCNACYQTLTFAKKVPMVGLKLWPVWHIFFSLKISCNGYHNLRSGVLFLWGSAKVGGRESKGQELLLPTKDL